MDTTHRPLSFARFIPPNQFGPVVTVARDDIVAIEAAYDKLSGESRTLLHLRGGSTLLVVELFRDAEVKIYGAQP